VKPEDPTPVEELVRLVGASAGVFARTLAAALARIDGGALDPIGSHFAFD
jgi:hypothetical protein